MTTNTIRSLTEAERRAILSAVHRIAETVASDVAAACAEAGEPLRNADLLDSICDGFRWQLDQVGGRGSVDAATLDKWESIPYRSRLRFLGKHCHYV